MLIRMGRVTVSFALRAGENLYRDEQSKRWVAECRVRERVAPGVHVYRWERLGATFGSREAAARVLLRYRAMRAQ